MASGLAPRWGAKRPLVQAMDFVRQTAWQVMGPLRSPTRGKPARHYKPAWHSKPASHSKPARHDAENEVKNQ